MSPELVASALGLESHLPQVALAYNDDVTDTALYSAMLKQAGYEHDASQIKIDPSERHHTITLETSLGKKFIKINKRGGGLKEYLGTLVFKNDIPKDVSLSFIPAEKLIVSRNVELLVQPYIPSAGLEGSTLFDVVCQMEFQTNARNVEIEKSSLQTT